MKGQSVLEAVRVCVWMRVRVHACVCSCEREWETGGQGEMVGVRGFFSLPPAVTSIDRR